MERVAFNAKRFHVSFTAHANRRLEKWQLTVSRMDVFCCHRRLLVRHGAVYQADIRARLGIQRSTMSVMLSRMEKHGLIQRRRSDSDRRKVVVTITPAGYAAFAEAEQLVGGGNYQSVVDINLRLLHFKEPIEVKRSRLLLYLDTLRHHFGDLSDIVYPAAPAPLDSPIQQCA